MLNDKSECSRARCQTQPKQTCAGHQKPEQKCQVGWVFGDQCMSRFGVQNRTRAETEAIQVRPGADSKYRPLASFTITDPI